MDFAYTNEQIEEILNWTLSGLTMYYRDSELPADVIAKYQVGHIFRSQTFVDVSAFAGQLTKSCRFIFASSKAAPLYKVNPEVEKWQQHTINADSYFKVLDIYQKEGKTQLFLLHIPAKATDFFKSAVLRLGEDNLEEQFIGKARASLDQKMKMPPAAALEEAEWVHRTEFPIGLDVKNEFFPLQPTTPLLPQAAPLANAIRKMTNDTALNKAAIVEPPAVKDTGRFWKKMF